MILSVRVVNGKNFKGCSQTTNEGESLSKTKIQVTPPGYYAENSSLGFLFLPSV